MPVIPRLFSVVVTGELGQGVQVILEAENRNLCREKNVLATKHIFLNTILENGFRCNFPDFSWAQHRRSAGASPSCDTACKSTVDQSLGLHRTIYSLTVFLKKKKNQQTQLQLYWMLLKALFFFKNVVIMRDHLEEDWGTKHFLSALLFVVQKFYSLITNELNVFTPSPKHNAPFQMVT